MKQLITMVAMIVLTSGLAKGQSDTCISKVVYDSLATGNQIAHEFGQSGFIENLFQQKAIQANLINNLEKQIRKTESMNTDLILSDRKCKIDLFKSKARNKALRFQIPIIAVIAGFAGYAIGAK